MINQITELIAGLTESKRDQKQWMEFIVSKLGKSSDSRTDEETKLMIKRQYEIYLEEIKTLDEEIIKLAEIIKQTQNV